MKKIKYLLLDNICNFVNKIHTKLSIILYDMVNEETQELVFSDFWEETNFEESDFI